MLKKIISKTCSLECWHGNKKRGGILNIQQQENGYLNYSIRIPLHFMQALKMTVIKRCNNIDISVTKYLVHKTENYCLLKILQPSKIFICIIRMEVNRSFPNNLFNFGLCNVWK